MLKKGCYLNSIFKIPYLSTMKNLIVINLYCTLFKSCVKHWTPSRKQAFMITY
jgi:hypothetical protein